MGKQSKYSWAIFNVTFVILLFGVVFLFAGCGGGGGGSSHKSTPTTYKLYPDGYFTAGTQESYNLTGSNTNGGLYTGTLVLETQSATTFNSAQAIPVDDELSLTNTVNSTTFTLTAVEYFSTDSNLELLGYHSDQFVGDATPGTSSLSVIPQTASIGDSGSVGTYTFSNGDILTITWKLTQASGSNANLVMSTTATTSTGTTLLTEENSFVIDQDGNRQSVLIVLNAVSKGISLTVSGDKS